MSCIIDSHIKRGKFKLISLKASIIHWYKFELQTNGAHNGISVKNQWLANKVWSWRGLAKPDTINKENNLPLGHKECTSVIQSAKQSQKGDKKDRGFSTGQGAPLNNKPCVWQNRKRFQLSKAVPSLLMTPISEAGNSPCKVQLSSFKGGQLLIANSSHLDKLVCLHL